MNLMFIGAAHEVTGSCTLLSACGKQILIDCGLEQGPNMFETCRFPLAAKDVDAIILTHAHIDHSGKIPFLVANGFASKVHCTEATRRLCAIMLRDSAHVQEFESGWRNRKAARSGDELYTPLYTTKDVERSMPLFVGHAYEEEVAVCPGITARFYDAGHLLGSSSVLLTIREDGVEKRILFSGDLGNPPRPLICAPAVPPKADYAVCESTYGDRLHGEHPSYLQQLAKVFRETFARGGNVVIPSFAVGRTQELLYLIRILRAQNLVPEHPDFPVYLDSPLAVEATQIYSGDLEGYLNAETKSLLQAGVNPIGFEGLRCAVTDADSRRINDDKAPKVIISAAGMCDAGRIRHHLKHNLWRPDSTVLFVGYQSEGTLGRALLDGAPYVTLFGEEIAVKAHIEHMQGFSCHADRDALVAWLKQVGAGKVFVNHGENQVCERFVATVQETCSCAAVAPYSGDVFDLASGQCLEQATVRPVSKKVRAHRRARAVYEALRLAGNRLMAVIESCRGGTNKELGRFTNQINALCDRYERKDKE